MPPSPLANRRPPGRSLHRLLVRTHLAAVAAACLLGLLLWSQLSGLGMPSAAALTFALLGAAGCGLYFSLRASRAVRAALTGLAALAGQIRAGRPHEVLLDQPEELQPLARQLGQLAEHFQQALYEATRRQRELSAVLAGLADGCVAVDPSGRILLFNGAAARLFGVSEQEALGRPLVEVIRSYDLVTAVQDALASGSPQVREFRIAAPEERTLQVTITILGGSGAQTPREAAGRTSAERAGAPAAGETLHPGPGPGAGPGRAAGAVALIRDVSELRRLERVRTDFVANVSHELRTPLTAIKGFIETLQEGAVEDEATRRRFLDIMARETDRLVDLINDLLELSRLESRSVPFHPRPVCVAEVAQAVVQMFSRKAEGKGLRLTARFPPELPPVLADEDMLRQVFINLLDNAVKYTHRGEIRVGARVADAEQGRRQVVVCVADTGIGIPRQHLGRIFERFYRVDRARSRDLGGTGLGLSIVRHIVELHGGRIEVESEVGVGSTFRVYLPAAEASRAEGPGDGQGGGQGAGPLERPAPG